jgi:hypothetical protein
MSFLTELPEDFYARDAFRSFSAREVFDLGTARAMMWLSQLAYEESPEKIDRIARIWGLELPKMVSGAISTALAVQDTAAFVASREEAILVAFSGTDPIKLANWVTDLSLGLPSGDTHSGFQDAVDAIWDSLEGAIRAAQAAQPSATLFFGGHSLGGALAVLAAERASHQARVSGVYTFGMPRVGRAAFGMRYAPLADRTYRLRYGEDIVPAVPPPEQGFHHVGLYFHCAGDKFPDARSALLRSSDEPSLIKDVLDDLRAIRDAGWLRRLPTYTLARLFLPDLLSPAPATRPDLIGVILEELPPALRDHVPHRYLGAL